MKVWMRAVAIVCLLLGGVSVASAQIAPNAAAAKLNNATSVLQQFVNIPENAIPQALLRSAYGIAVIPSVFKISFLGGVEHGTGVLSVRTNDGKWSDPTFISLTGGSVGFQAGISSTDIILVFKTERSVENLANGQITLGGDASVAAGPVGRSAAAATNLDFNAEVYSYSRSRGLFGGVSLGGARIGIDQQDNWLFYNQPGISAQTLLSRDSSNLPAAGARFVYTLNQYMPPSNDQFNYGADTRGNDNSNDMNNSAGNGASNSGSNGNGSTGSTQPYRGSSPSGGISVQQNDTNRTSSGVGQGTTGQTSNYTGDSSNYGGNYGNNTSNSSSGNGSGHSGNGSGNY